MQKLAEICIRRPVFAAMLILALVVVGAASYWRLGVDRFPSVDLPTVSIRTTLPGASPEEVETEVSERIEEVVNTVEGIDELRSISGSGQSFVIATFNLDRDIDVAAQDVRDRVYTVMRDLPEDVQPPVVSKANQNDNEPVLTIALSGDRSLRELNELADKLLKVRLERSKGVGEIRIVGGVERAMNVWIDADKLVAHGLPITAVRDAILAQNADVPGGNVTGGEQERQLRTSGKLRTEAEFNEMVITTINDVPIKVKDVGRAEDGTKEVRSTARLNGVPAVTIEVSRQSGANTVEVIEAVKANLEPLRAQLPPDVQMQIIRDQSQYIYAALHEIKTHLVLGSILACLVVLAFMRNWRSTIIAGVAIPASVISTFGMMWALDFTLNSVTMLALVLMVGVVIDDAIVVLENIFRFVEEKRMRPIDAAREATGEIGLAVLATTLSLVVIFIPVSFMSSISGRFLYQFGITAAVAVLVSLLVSFTLTPMMSARLLRARDVGGDGGGGHDNARSRRGFYGRVERVYVRLLAWAMRHRLAISIVALLVIASSVPLYRLVPQEFVPSDTDEAEFQVRVEGPQGASPLAMADAMLAVERELLETPGVRVVLTTAGGGFLGAANSGSAYVRIAPHEERILSFGRVWRETLAGNPLNAFRNNYSQSDVMQAIRARLRKYPELRPTVRNFAGFNIGGGNFDIDFVIRGPDLEGLARYGDQLRDDIRADEIRGIVDANTTLRLDKPEIHVRIDRERAADLGVDARDIGTAVRLMVGGDEELSRFRDPQAGEDYDVQLRLNEADRSDPDLIRQLYLPRQGGGLVELGSIASLEPIDSAGRIDRSDRQREVRLRAGIAPGYAMADRLDALRQAAADMNLPAEYSIAVSGKGRELERSFVEFLYAFALSVVFMYMILAMNYESLIHPFTILLSLPLTVPFALLSLWLSGGTLNLYSALGLLVLFGVVKKNAILQIDHMNHLREQGMPRPEAIMQGNRNRLRPILMTTLTLVAGMLPLWLGTGPGAEERRAVAVVVIGGQSLALLLTLLVTPVAYSLLDDAGAWLARRRRARAEHAPEASAGAIPTATIHSAGAGS